MNTREFYNRTAEIYDSRINAPTGRLIEKGEMGLVNRFSGGKVLDLGCGTGRTLVPGAVGLDISEGMLRRSKRNLMVQGDGEELPLKSSSFDTVLCFKSVLSMCDYGNMVKEISRVLRPGGTALVSLASIWDTFTTLSEKKKSRNPPKTKKLTVNKNKLEIYLFDKQELIVLFKKNGLELEHFSSLFIRQNPRWGTWNVSLKDRFRLFLEKLSDKDYGALYLAAFTKK